MITKIFTALLLLVFSISQSLHAQLPDFKVNDDQGNADQQGSSITTDINGNFVITWQDERNSYKGDIYAQRYLSDGTVLGNNFKVNDDQTENDQWPPSISGDNSGNFVITWIDGRHQDQYGRNWDVYAQRYSSDGSAIGANFKVNDDTGIADQITAFISTDNSGNFVIAWSDYRDNRDYPDIYAQRFSSDGNPLGTNFKVNNNPSGSRGSSSICTEANGNFVIAWKDERNSYYGDVYAQRYSSDGTALGGNIKVNDDQTDNVQTSPSISSKDNGDFIITWGDGRNASWDIYAQRYTNDGSTIGSNFKVNDDQSSGDQRSPSVSIDNNNNSVITWNDERNENREIYAQNYASDGSLVGSNYKAATTNSAYTSSRSTKLCNGKIYITWTDDRAGYYIYDVWACVVAGEFPTGISVKKLSHLPSSFIFNQNYPNPFNPTTTINYQLPENSHVNIIIYNLHGHVVAILVDEEKIAGSYSVNWNAVQLSSGMYMCKMQAGNFMGIHKLMLLK
jgi:hypothetical protein